MTFIAIGIAVLCTCLGFAAGAILTRRAAIVAARQDLQAQRSQLNSSVAEALTEQRVQRGHELGPVRVAQQLSREVEEASGPGGVGKQDHPECG